MQLSPLYYCCYEKVERLHRLSSQALRSVLPGQHIGYYIKDETINQLTSEVSPGKGLLSFQGNGIFYYTLPTYFSTRIRAGNSPILHIPYSVAEEYTFKSGGIYQDMPELFNKDGSPNGRYLVIQAALVRESEADQTDKTLFVKIWRQDS